MRGEPLEKQMSERLRNLVAGLSREERQELLDLLRDSLANGPAEDVKAAWDAELDRRWQQIEKGEVTGIPVEQMAAELRKKCG
jgi:putative addiction module component (TIGR02574 family)